MACKAIYLLKSIWPERGKGDLKKALSVLPTVPAQASGGFDPYKIVIDGYTLYIRALESEEAGQPEQARDILCQAGCRTLN